ncbi:MAG: ArnT family glycosyltransferase [Anaerolineae bacterium]
MLPVNRLTNNQSTRTQLRAWLPLAVIVTIFIALGGYYSVTTPIWEAPDEPGHFGNVWHIVKYKQLPKYVAFGTAHHSPLYYIIAAVVVSGVDMPDPATWTRYNPNAATISPANEPNIAFHSIRELSPYREIALGVHLARGVTMIFGTVTVAVTYLLARRLFPDQVWIAIGAAGLVAFNPQFIFMSAVVHNDVPLSMGFALALWPALRIIEGDRRRRQFLGLGGLVGLAIILKQSGIILIGLAAMVILWAAWRSKQWSMLLRWSGWTALSLAIVAGPMYARNIWLYGDPFVYRLHKALHPPVTPLRLSEVTGEMWLAFFRRMHASFWGYFGWVTLPLPNAVYNVLWLLYPLALVGLAVWLWRGRASPARRNDRLFAIVLLLTGIAAVWTFTIRYALTFGAFGVQGRYLFQMISAQAILISLGLCSLLSGRWRAVPIGATLLGLLALASWAPQGVIAPAYEYLGDPPQVVDSLQYKRDDVFGDVIELAGYNSSVDLQSGQVQVALYWRTLAQPAKDYTIFVHLVNAQGDRYSQDDRQPLDGDFPTSQWRSGDVMHTEHQLLADAACLQVPCYLAVGLYNLETGERLPVTQGQSKNNAVSLNEFLANLGG